MCELATKAENTNCLFDNNNNSNTRIVYSDANNLTILQLYNTERYWESRGDDEKKGHSKLYTELAKPEIESMCEYVCVRESF